MVVERYATVRGFVKILCRVIEFEATADAQKVLTRHARPAGPARCPAYQASTEGLPGRPPGQRGPGAGRLVAALVFPKDSPEGTVDRNAYVFCVLELFQTGLRHRDIFATVSDRWSDPRARLLAGSRWDDAKGAALSALQLPEDLDALLAAHAADLDAAWRAAAGGIIPDGDVSVDAEGRLHVGKDNALEEPASLIDLRSRTAGMLPGVDLPEMTLEVMAGTRRSRRRSPRCPAAPPGSRTCTSRSRPCSRRTRSTSGSARCWPMHA